MAYSMIRNKQYDEYFLRKIKDTSVRLGNRDKDNSLVFNLDEIKNFTNTINTIQYKHFMMLLDAAFDYEDKRRLVDAIDDIALIKQYANGQVGLLDLVMNLLVTNPPAEEKTITEIRRIQNKMISRLLNDELVEYCIQCLRLYFAETSLEQFIELHQKLSLAKEGAEDRPIYCQMLINIRERLCKMATMAKE